MGSPSQSRHPGRLTAVVVAVAFAFQLTRFFLVVPLDSFVCYEPKHSQESSLPGHHHHDNDEEHAGAPHQHDNGTYFQHCKDTFAGIGLTPVQPLAMPLAVSPAPAELSLPQLLPPSARAAERSLPPPFQPPRNLA